MFKAIILFSLMAHLNLKAQNLGVVGHLFEIEEPNLLQVIEQSLQSAVGPTQPSVVPPQGISLPRTTTHHIRRWDPKVPIVLLYRYIFFNGEDPLQIEWVKHYLKSSILEKKSVKLILTSGSLKKTSKILNSKIYFDQSGAIAKKLNLTHVPAILSQNQKEIQLEEVIT